MFAVQRVSKLRKPLYNFKGVIALFSSENAKEVLVYEGIHGRRLKRLRRVSFISSVLSVILMPLSMTVDSGLVPVAGQMAYSTVLLFGSLSSTVFLQAFCHPYVVSLREFATPEGKSISSDRKFKAERSNILGNSVYSEFSLSDVEKSASNPFASFKLKSNGSFYYVFGGNMQDPALKVALTRDMTTTSST